MAGRFESSGADGLALRTASAIEAVREADWDRCAGADDPFVSHAFLRILEQSGSATAEAGWLPQHLLVEDRDGRLLAAAPLYLKGHSFGEYVFDWGWAEAYERAGHRYYPKLQCCVPFTPVPGARLLVRPGADAATLRPLMLAAMAELTGKLELSSAHLTFVTRDEWSACRRAGWLVRSGVQFHWPNRGYSSFDDFLAGLIARKRKAIKRERRQAVQSGLRLRTLRGGAIEPGHWEAVYRFYRNTCDHKWGRPYLERAFFEQLGPALGDRLVLMLADDGGEPVAGALHVLGSRALYGRYWGTTIEAKWLHFELCYYRAIELAIELGLERVEAGAQGPHKLQRGYVAVPTYSAHWVEREAFREAVAHALEREAGEQESELDYLAELSPYRDERERVREARAGHRPPPARRLARQESGR